MDLRVKLLRNLDTSGDWVVQEFEGAKVLCCLDGPVEIVDSLDAKVQRTNGQLLATRTSDIDD